MNNHILPVLAALIRAGKNGSQRQAIMSVMYEMPLMLVMELCLHVCIFRTWSGFTVTISTASYADKERPDR